MRPPLVLALLARLSDPYRPTISVNWRSHDKRHRLERFSVVARGAAELRANEGNSKPSFALGRARYADFELHRQRLDRELNVRSGGLGVSRRKLGAQTLEGLG